jgi:uncharacterized membrane protein YbhN (UPF0104 family)
VFKLSTHISPRRLAVTLVPVILLVVVAATPQLLGRQLAHAAGTLSDASPGWLWLSVAAFLASILCTAGSLRSAICATGTQIGRYDTAARYGVGCLVNTFAPASLGEAARVALLAQKVEAPNGFWSVGGAAAAVSAVRGVTLCGLILTAALLTHAVPLWPIAAICGGAAGAAGVAYVLWRRHPHGRLGHFVGAFAALIRSPRATAAVLGWSVGSQLARLLAAAAVAAALSVPHPLLAAIVIMPTLQLATMFPITPGNVGVATGAVALALQTRGVEVSQALATGLAYHAAETLVGISFGVAGTLAVVELPPLVRRLAAATACIGLAACVGATVVSLV